MFNTSVIDKKNIKDHESFSKFVESILPGITMPINRRCHDFTSSPRACLVGSISKINRPHFSKGAIQTILLLRSLPWEPTTEFMLVLRGDVCENIHELALNDILVVLNIEVCLIHNVEDPRKSNDVYRTREGINSSEIFLLKIDPKASEELINKTTLVDARKLNPQKGSNQSENLNPNPLKNTNTAQTQGDKNDDFVKIDTEISKTSSPNDFFSPLGSDAGNQNEKRTINFSISSAGKNDLIQNFMNLNSSIPRVEIISYDNQSQKNKKINNSKEKDAQNRNSTGSQINKSSSGAFQSLEEKKSPLKINTSPDKRILKSKNKNDNKSSSHLESNSSNSKVDIPNIPQPNNYLNNSEPYQISKECRTQTTCDISDDENITSDSSLSLQSIILTSPTIVDSETNIDKNKNEDCQDSTNKKIPTLDKRIDEISNIEKTDDKILKVDSPKKTTKQISKSELESKNVKNFFNIIADQKTSKNSDLNSDKVREIPKIQAENAISIAKDNENYRIKNSKTNELNLVPKETHPFSNTANDKNVDQSMDSFKNLENSTSVSNGLDIFSLIKSPTRTDNMRNKYRSKSECIYKGRSDVYANIQKIAELNQESFQLNQISDKKSPIENSAINLKFNKSPVKYKQNNKSVANSFIGEISGIANSKIPENTETSKILQSPQKNSSKIISNVDLKTNKSERTQKNSKKIKDKEYEGSIPLTKRILKRTLNEENSEVISDTPKKSRMLSDSSTTTAKITDKSIEKQFNDIPSEINAKKSSNSTEIKKIQASTKFAEIENNKNANNTVDNPQSKNINQISEIKEKIVEKVTESTNTENKNLKKSENIHNKNYNLNVEEKPKEINKNPVSNDQSSNIIIVSSEKNTEISPAVIIISNKIDSPRKVEHTNKPDFNAQFPDFKNRILEIDTNKDIRNILNFNESEKSSCKNLRKINYIKLGDLKSGIFVNICGYISYCKGPLKTATGEYSLQFGLKDGSTIGDRAATLLMFSKNVDYLPTNCLNSYISVEEARTQMYQSSLQIVTNDRCRWVICTKINEENTNNNDFMEANKIPKFQISSNNKTTNFDISPIIKLDAWYTASQIKAIQNDINFEKSSLNLSSFHTNAMVCAIFHYPDSKRMILIVTDGTVCPVSSPKNIDLSTCAWCQISFKTLAHNQNTLVYIFIDNDVLINNICLTPLSFINIHLYFKKIGEDNYLHVSPDSTNPIFLLPSSNPNIHDIKSRLFSAEKLKPNWCSISLPGIDVINRIMIENAVEQPSFDISLSQIPISQNTPQLQEKRMLFNSSEFANAVCMDISELIHNPLNLKDEFFRVKATLAFVWPEDFSSMCTSYCEKCGINIVKKTMHQKDNHFECSECKSTYPLFLRLILLLTDTINYIPVIIHNKSVFNFFKIEGSLDILKPNICRKLDEKFKNFFERFSNHKMFNPNNEYSVQDIILKKVMIHSGEMSTQKESVMFEARGLSLAASF